MFLCPCSSFLFLLLSFFIRVLPIAATATTKQAASRTTGSQYGCEPRISWPRVVQTQILEGKVSMSRLLSLFLSLYRFLFFT